MKPLATFEKRAPGTGYFWLGLLFLCCLICGEVKWIVGAVQAGGWGALPDATTGVSLVVDVVLLLSGLFGSLGLLLLMLIDLVFVRRQGTRRWALATLGLNVAALASYATLPFLGPRWTDALIRWLR